MALFGGEESLSIVVKLRDEASKQLDDLQSKFKRFNSSMQPAIDASQTFAIGLTAVGTAMGAIGATMLKSAADAEQTQIAFTTMLGSAEKATQFTKDLASFAAKTPFELKGLEQSSKQLLAYGFAQNEVLPNLKSLGDIASGVGMDKLPQLIMAFGQVKAATKLTGNELRQFTEAGVPLLQALVDQMNATGGKMTIVGETSKKTAKEIAGLHDETRKYKNQLESANDTLLKQQNRLAEMIAKHKTSGSSYSNLGIDIQNTKEKIQKLTAEIGANNSKLGELGPVSAGVSQSMKYTVADIQDMVSKGVIGFDQVQKAMASMSGEGGRFANLMDKQSQSLGGMVSNLSDAWEQFLRGQGALFIEWAKQAVAALTVFIQTTLPQWVIQLQNATEWLGKHKEVLYIVAGAIMGALVPAVYAAVTAFVAWGVALAPFIIGGAIIGGVVAGIMWIIKNWDFLVSEAKITMAAIGIIWGEMWAGFNNTITTIWDGIKSTISSSVNWVIDKVNMMLNAINSVSAAGASLFGLSNKSISIPNIPKLAEGGIVSSPTIAMIGEAGPEAVVPLSKMGGMGGGMTVVINNPSFNNRDDEDRMRRMLDSYFRPLVLNNKL